MIFFTLVSVYFSSGQLKKKAININCVYSAIK
jgi:hypothetical protein